MLEGNYFRHSIDPDAGVPNIETMIRYALADGRLSRKERDRIMAAILGQRPVSPDRCRLFRTVQERIWLGEILIDG